MSVTLRELALHCQVDVSTVSRALRDDPRVKSATSKRIKEVAERLGYRANINARNLVTGRTGTVLFLVDHLRDPITQEPVGAAAELLRNAGYDLLIALHHSTEAGIQRCCDRLVQGQADAALIIPDYSGLSRPWASLGLPKSAPVVVIDRPIPGLDRPCVGTDQDATIAAMLEQGQRWGISGVINGFTDGNPVDSARKAALERLAHEASLPLLPAEGQQPSNVMLAASGQIAVHKNMQKCQGPAYAAVFDRWLGPTAPFSEIVVAHQDFNEIAKRAVDVLLQSLQGEQEHKHVLVPIRDIEIVS